MSDLAIVSFAQPAGAGAFEVTAALDSPGKAAMLWMNGRTAVGLAAHAGRAFGVMASPSERAYVATAMMDGRSLNFGSQKWATRQRRADRAIGFSTISSGGSISTLFEADFTGFTPAGFALDVGVTDGVARQVRGLVIGGAAEAAVGSFVTLTSFPATQDITCGFQPTFVVFLTSAILNPAANDQNAHVGVGFAVDNAGTPDVTAGAVTGLTSGVSTDTGQSAALDSAMHITAAVQTMRLSVSSWLPDGFRISYTTNNGSEYDVYWLAIGGITARRAHALSASTFPATQLVSIPGITPQGILTFASRPTGAGGAVRPHARHSFGAALAPTNRTSVFMGATDAVSSTQSRDDLSDTRLMRLITEPSTVNHELELLSFADGSATVDWVVASGVGRQWSLVALNVPPAPATLEEAVKLGKARAIRALVEQIKTINGEAGGYFTDLGGRVYTVLYAPDQAAELELPYVCIPLVNEAERFIEHDDTFIEVRWNQVIYAYLEERGSHKLDGPGVYRAAEMRDDICRALMQNPWGSLVGLGHDQIREVKFVSCDSVAGIRVGEPDYAEVAFIVELAQWIDRNVLGPG